MKNELNYVTSGKKFTVTDEDPHKPLEALYRQLQAAIIEYDVTDVHVIHTHPEFSPLSYTDTSNGNRYFAQMLEGYRKNGVIDHYYTYATSRMGDHVIRE